MSIGQRIKCVCKERGMTVKELDKLAFPNTKGQTIGRWEENRPSIDKVVTVAQILGVPIDYLVGLTDEKSPAPSEGVGMSEARLAMMAELDGMTEDEIWDIIESVKAAKAIIANSKKRKSPAKNGEAD